MIFVLVIYGVMLCFISIFVAFQLVHWMHYKRYNKKELVVKPLPESLPLVTIQLPVYNEKYVIERLIRSVCEIDYPKDKLEIQVLDDSNDETTDIINNCIASLDGDIDIKNVRRPVRKGYKAGALD